MGLTPILHFAFENLAISCLDSELASTREFWRRKFNFPESIVTDPRPLREIALEQSSRGGGGDEK